MSSIVAPETTMNEIFNPPELGEPKGYSHAIRAGNTIYLAGQVGAGATIEEQFGNALGSLTIALKAAGGEPQDLVSLQVYVTDIPAYKAALSPLGRAWRQHFGTHYPAMGLFGVTGRFDPDALVEVMGVAVVQPR
jgi:enamine deaminase RidA (YjgF/YER057c/UK114 family)